MIFLRLRGDLAFYLLYILQARRANNGSMYPWNSIGNVEVNPFDLSPHTVLQYLDQLSAEQLSSLWVIYEDDFELFGFVDY